jgi:hypothetical protein
VESELCSLGTLDGRICRILGNVRSRAYGMQLSPSGDSIGRSDSDQGQN